MPQDRYQTGHEIAERLEVAVATVRHWIKSGELRAIDIGKGWRISNTDVESFLKSRETSPRAAWEMPDDLRADLATAALCIYKGDANYRRLLGDAHWPYSTPFGAAVGFFAPCPLLALRTLKAGCGVGVPVEAATRAAALDEHWRTSGRFGVAQLARPGECDGVAV